MTQFSGFPPQLERIMQLERVTAIGNRTPITDGNLDFSQPKIEVNDENITNFALRNLVVSTLWLQYHPVIKNTPY